MAWMVAPGTDTGRVITAHLIQLRAQARGLQVVGEVLPQVAAAGCSGSCHHAVPPLCPLRGDAPGAAPGLVIGRAALISAA